MTQFIKKESQKELLKNDRFILWVLFPNEELDTFWRHYTQCYPEEKETLEKAKADFKKIKLNAFQLSDIEKRRLIQSVKRTPQTGLEICGSLHFYIRHRNLFLAIPNQFLFSSK